MRWSAWLKRCFLSSPLHLMYPACPGESAIIIIIIIIKLMATHLNSDTSLSNQLSRIPPPPHPSSSPD